MTPAAILALVTELAKAGTAGLEFWQSLAAVANQQVKDNLIHDAQQKPAPDPGPKE